MWMRDDDDGRGEDSLNGYIITDDTSNHKPGACCVVTQLKLHNMNIGTPHQLLNHSTVPSDVTVAPHHRVSEWRLECL